MPSTERAVHDTPDYLNSDYGIKSWLLTTDHKRIAILYLISVSLFFLIGGIFAAWRSSSIAWTTIWIITP